MDKPNNININVNFSFNLFNINSNFNTHHCNCRKFSGQPKIEDLTTKESETKVHNKIYPQLSAKDKELLDDILKDC